VYATVPNNVGESDTKTATLRHVALNRCCYHPPREERISFALINFPLQRENGEHRDQKKRKGEKI
jgi:hypothetical protein